MQTNQKLNYLYFLLVASFWGGSFVAIKVVINYFPPLFGAMIRVGSALLILMIIFSCTREDLRVPFNLKWRMWITALFAQAIPFGLLFWGERYISSGLAGILNGTIPIWAFIIGVIFFGHTDLLTPRKTSGLLVGLSGIFIIFLPLVKFNHSHNEIYGTIAVIFMAISYAIGAIFNQRLFAGKHKVRVQANIYHQMWANFIALAIASFIFEPWPHFGTFIHSYTPLLASLYLGLFSTALALLMYYYLIREWGAVRASATTYVSPIMALLWDFLFFKNQPTWFELVGVITILCGVLLIQSCPKNRVSIIRFAPPSQGEAAKG